LIRVGPLVVSGSFFAETKDDCSATVAAGLLGPPVRFVRFGWGWDNDLPLSPLPAAYSAQRERYYDWCFAWCGFFIGFSAGESDTGPVP